MFGDSTFTDTNGRDARVDGAPLGSQSARDQLLAYYTEAALDYRAWSRGFNMHFGFWRPGLNPLRREAMLEELNVQALSRLQIPTASPARLVDLGGGTGATARAAVAKYPQLDVDVVTIVPRQVEIGTQLNAHAPRGDAVTMRCADYTATALPAGAYDAVCLIESACHAPGPTKASVLAEAFRLLKPGGRLVMVDAMLLRQVPTDGLLSRFMNRVYRRWCLSWAVPEMCRLDLLPEAMGKIGFEDARFENWSWKVAPSVAHVPLFASAFAVVEIVKAKGRLPLWRWRHIVASLLTPLLGLRQCTFVYGAVTATKPPGAAGSAS
jgi:MPBQ/MSBQ methyltransferase